MKIKKYKRDKCILWEGWKNEKGYGQIKIKGKTYKMHRLVYEQTHGPIPNGLHVLHKCDIRNCINPSHLFLGTHADNMADMSRKGRYRIPDNSGEKNGQAKLTSKQVDEIKSLYLQPNKPSQKEIGKLFGVSQMTISLIVRDKRWK
jgi:hypothetical protein